MKLGINLHGVQSFSQSVKVHPLAILQLKTIEPSPSLIVAAIIAAIYPSPANLSQRRNHDGKKSLPTLRLLLLRALPIFNLRTSGSRQHA
jgi:hypothetical protein